MSSQVPFLYPLSEDGSPGEPWELDRPSLMVGRGESSDITVFDDALSRGHFLIVREAGEFFVVDLDSQNGTKVDDRQVTGCKLKSGQIISAGTSRFQFSIGQRSFQPPRDKVERERRSAREIGIVLLHTGQPGKRVAHECQGGH